MASFILKDTIPSHLSKDYQPVKEANVQNRPAGAFTNPCSGSDRAGIIASNGAKEGYNSAKQEGGSFESQWYQGKDEDGNAIKFKFHISATASQRPQFVISEIRF
ncbi:uncharacterized protein RAG0_05815 [Rhynchosporium agropyri]|uniref:Uncharacterized protein n=1 Tax=Rhynchosporium agropyri TaxID=914238 RepID=A0A1E1KIC2_9HELO|nr:uncharacterized protein RAG0_05815 [Rhynchosporium agropyri]